MGLLDAPAPAYTSPRLDAFHRALQLPASDVYLLVLGDSTGAGITRFPRLLANYFAAQYPKWSVVYDAWDDSSKTYPTANRVTVQTGTNGFTLYIKNGSVSGQVIGYARDNMATLTAGFSASLIYFNYAHNSPQLGDGYRYLMAETVNRYRNQYPKAAIVVGTQNPRDPAAWPLSAAPNDYASDDGKQRAVYEWAVAQGFPVVDINRIFYNYGSNWSSALMLADGLHPNDNAGSPLWAKSVWNVIRPRGAIVSPGHQPDSNRIWIPAREFYAVDGTPTLTSAYGLQAWSLPNGSLNSIAALVDIPSAWKAQNIHAITTAAAAGAAGQTSLFSASHQYVGTSTGIGGAINLGTWVSDNAAVTNGANYTAGRTQDNTLWDRITLGASPVALKVGRDGTSSADTFASAILLLGLMIEQAY
ncbi:SGNH/GDSL hydrolase family protein [Curtobacterium sp. MCBA15_012]|uniref:SGNH/GDSL hydrolase family protein n=1 Tax=Curtobacterium sp. MCBA15_012 TaxID=1898738 RepID=UPI0008DC8002|nr:SGNH/GDSL hydrolase family protein [Curtobacterium sp. MCBA15_012]WIA99759.1 SGNH/GDSL hydrolase family protein [Curtobacterium sp. MCBA15_012]